MDWKPPDAQKTLQNHLRCPFVARHQPTLQTKNAAPHSQGSDCSATAHPSVHLPQQGAAFRIPNSHQSGGITWRFRNVGIRWDPLGSTVVESIDIFAPLKSSPFGASSKIILTLW